MIQPGVRRLSLLGNLPLAIALCACVQAAEPKPAHPEGPVVDLADILPPATEGQLDNILRSYFAETGDSLVVATVPSLEGRSIEDYAFDLFNGWGIGNPDTDRGLLILVAPNERKVRIEVGCGLEGIVTDAVAATIIQERMLPEFRQGNLDGGTVDGVDGLIDYLASPAAANDNGPQTPICKTQAKEAA